MNERFQFEFARRFCAQLGDFLERHFARQHHARRAHIGINARRRVIQAVRLRAYVNGKVRRGFANGGNRAEVGDDHRVGSEKFERLRVIRKRVDVAVFSISKAVKDGSWKPGVQVLGLKENGVALAMDEHNAKLVTPEMKKKLDAAQADIVAGRIKVADYMADNACRY